MNDSKESVSIIVAMDLNNLIGDKNSLPWKIPGELARFRKLTMGKPIIMGRKTHEAIGKILDGRVNIVLSRDLSYNKDGISVYSNFTDAIKSVKDNSEIFVIGGEDIFKQCMPFAKKLYVTHINKEFKGDTWFPKIDKNKWKIISREDCFSNEKNINYSYLIYQRTSE